MNALMQALQTLVDPGAVWVTTTPSCPNLPAAPQILSGAIRSAPLSPGTAGWRLDLERLFDAGDSRTRLIFLNSPNNRPAG
jgi:aspartate aminotransferase